MVTRHALFLRWQRGDYSGCRMRLFYSAYQPLEFWFCI
jgi:hypothetical protein